MVMKKGSNVNVSGKPKHSLDVNRRNGKTGIRSAGTVRRPNMYNTRPVRDAKGNILKHDLQEKNFLIHGFNLICFSIFEMSSIINLWIPILKERLLPMSLLNDHQKQARAHLLDTEPFKDAFGPQRKRRPKLLATGYESLIRKADGSQVRLRKRLLPIHHLDLVRHTMFEKGQSKRIWGELYKVIDSSDVVVQVLDARDPQGTRCYHLETHLKEHCRHKHMVFLLNKCDLVPANIPHWLFMLALINLSGKGSLLSVLWQFAGLKSDKQAISVGFVGYSNVGKSSVINTLRTKSVCKVAPIPGETKVWKYITLMKPVFLIDCPGVVYQNSDNETDIVLKGVVRATNLEDATEHIEEVLKRVKKEHLQRAYKINDWVDQDDFLTQLCRISGKLLKGGEPDMTCAAKMVLHDWQRGRIPFFVPPPKLDNANDQLSASSSNEDIVIDNNGASAAMLAITNVITSQQLKSVPVQKNLFEQNELEVEDPELASGQELDNESDPEPEQ
ncbi:hypothetical protein MKX01_041693 [Papaver californicum]|nr:hypothetical protein MKX01_041693 [Papaver californicum]